MLLIFVYRYDRAVVTDQHSHQEKNFNWIKIFKNTFLKES